MTIMSEAPSSATVTPNVAPTTSATSSSQTADTLSPTSVIVVTSVRSQDGEKTIITSTATVSNSQITGSPNSQPINLGSRIAGIVCAALGVMIIATVVFFLLRWRRRRRNPPHAFRKFSLKENLDPMYRNTRSLKSIFKSDTPSELIGSVPDVSSSESVGEKQWEKHYESPNDFGKLLIPKPSASNLKPVSPLSQNSPDDNKEPTEKPSQGELAKPDIVYELPERSNTRKSRR